MSDGARGRPKSSKIHSEDLEAHLNQLANSVQVLQKEKDRVSAEEGLVVARRSWWWALATGQGSAKQLGTS